MLTLIGSSQSPYVNKVSALLCAKNINFESKRISLNSKPDWFTKIAPFGKVPVLLLENQSALFESDAICDYLNNVCQPSLYPNNALEAAKAKAICFSINTCIGYTISMLFAKDKALFRVYIIKIQKYLAELNQLDFGSNYFINNNLSMVDIYLAVILVRLKTFEKITGLKILSPLNKLNNLSENLINTSWLNKSLPINFEDEFAKLFLPKIQAFLVTK